MKMNVLVFAQSNYVVERIVRELAHSDQLINFCNTSDYDEAVDFFTSYRPEIIILDLDGLSGNGNNFLNKLRDENPGIQEVILTQAPAAKIILTNFQKIHLEQSA